MSFRKTTQFLAPARTPAVEGYDIYPAFPATGAIDLGFDALAQRLAAHEHIVLDGMTGVLWDDFRARLTQSFTKLGVSYEWLAVQPSNVDVTPFLGGDDPLFGRRCTLTMRDFIQPVTLPAKRRIVYGAGAALVADGFLVYLDVPKNEIQFRMRAGNPVTTYKRLYFVDWPVQREHQRELLPRLDLIVDTQRPDEPTAMSGAALRAGLTQMSRNFFRVRPWFEPGPWGGQWMKQRFQGLPADAVNLAWSFELIVPENGLVFQNGPRVEVAFDWLMFHDHRAILGDCADRFRYEFPIRFDYLDTFDGGNLSVQCHPRPDYIRQHFGETFTQDETYYITDCTPDASVYLGFRDGVKPDEFRRAVRQPDLDVERWVNKLPAQKHGLYLIPNGTIHCSGKNNLVLEISATPYIFTFKMFDWNRLDLDGKPRPLNIDRALENLHFDRPVSELVSQPREIAPGLIHLPTHREHFYDVHRFEFTGTVTAQTNGSPHILNVVEGGPVTLDTGMQQRFPFAETFVVPAATGTYRLTSERPAKVIKAFMKP